MFRINQLWVNLVVSVGATALMTACTNSGHAPGGTDIDMPLITTAVNGGASFASILPRTHTQAVTGSPLNSSSCANCNSGANYTNVWSLASTFVLQGKLADSNSCMVAAVVSNDIVPGLTSGEYKYLNSSNGITMKVKVALSGTTVSSYELYTCVDGEQVQYISATDTNGDVTFKFRATGSTLFVAMDATGKLADGQWTSKVLDAGFYSSSGTPTYDYFQITQQSDYLDVTGYLDSGTLGTQDVNDVRIVSRAQLLGDTPQNYAMGDGAVRTATGAGAASNTNWNGDTGVEGAGPTTYDSAVASATLPTAPTTRATAFTADETWDCQMVGGGIDFLASAASNPTFLAQGTACTEEFQ